MKRTHKQNGITLVALVITIVILVILAGISISALTNQGLFTKAQNAKDLTEEKTAEENETLTNYLEQMDIITGTLKIKSVAPSTETTHTATAITFTWDELSTIAKMISNNSSITNDTAEVQVETNLGAKTLGVGDTATVDSKTVRILGFNHDTLTTATAYGETTATGKAGISFEYVDFIDVDGNGTIKAGMNSTNTNTGGWGASALRSTLNSTTYNNLSIKGKIKQVNKEFIQTYNDANSIDENNPSTDYLWLLSCGEIWANGYNGGVTTRGYAIATEGSQYKYYKSTLGSTTYSSSTAITKKPNTSSATSWWLRSPRYGDGDRFCDVDSDGSCYNNYASGSRGVAPGFCI